MYTMIPIRHKGNDSLFLALEMSLISTAAGIPMHVHAEGLRGTGKTTVMRWARNMAPGITRIRGCVYQCRPDFPHCPLHSAAGCDGRMETERVPMPFIEIGHGAKLGTILGSVDLAKITDPREPQAALLPGAIPVANRGIVFIDEINRLAETAPEITDVLLSLMGTKPGKIKIEEVGLEPWEIHVSSSVWAASNPDEDPGPLEEIRRQLSDRFDVVVPVHRPSDPQVVQELLLSRSLSRHQAVPGPDSDRQAWIRQAPDRQAWDQPASDRQASERPASDRQGYNLQASDRWASYGSSWDRRPMWVRKLSDSILKKAREIRNVTVPPEIVRYMANLYVEYNIESLRAIESLELTARCLAAIREKQEVSFDEISTVMPMVLRHRTEPIVLSEILKDLELRKAAGAEARTNQAQEKDADSCDTQPSNDAPPASDPSGVPKASEVSDGDASKAGGDTRPKGNLHPVKGRAAPVPRFGPGFGTTLNPQAPFCRQDRTDGPANQDPAGHNGHRQASWLHKLLSRYHRNMRDPDVKQSKGIRAQDAAGGHFEAGPDAAKGSASQQGAHGAGKAPGTPGAHGIHGARGVRGVHGAHGVHGADGAHGVHGGDGVHGAREAQSAPGSSGTSPLETRPFTSASPMSPPEPGRAISELNWEEILLPFIRKGNEE